MTDSAAAQDKQRRKYQTQRWLSVVCMGTWAGALVALCKPVVTANLPKLEQFVPLSPWMQFTGFAILTLGLVGYAGWNRWVGFLGLRHFRRYPPLWVAVLIGILVERSLSASEADRQAAVRLLCSHEMILGGVVCTVVGVLYVVLSRLLQPVERPIDRREPVDNLPPQPPKPLSPDVLLEWIRDDTPVTKPEYDYFGHSAVAKRIADRLSTSGKAPTIAVVGEKGSGKSTILALVKYYLREKNLLDKRIILVEISLWPFETADAAVIGILDELTTALGKHVNTLALTRLAKKYVNAVSSSSLNLSAITSLIEDSASPETILKEIESIVAAIDMKLVLWIEDLERFAGADRAPVEGKADDKLGSIRAMLYLLDKSEHISVLLADASLENRLDSHKIARFIEQPPAIRAAEVWKMVAAFRFDCLDSSKVLDSASKEIRDRFKSIETIVKEAKYETWFYTDSPTREVAFSVLLNTPRLLKASLRLTADIWAQLAGEVDFDDVLMMNVIRVARPNLFALIDQSVVAMQRGIRANPDLPLDRNIRSDHFAGNRLNELLDKEKDKERETISYRVIRQIINEIFPRYEHVWTDPDNVPDSFTLQKPQGFSSDSTVDYWRRYTSVSISERQSDQDILRAIQDSKNGSSSYLVELAATDDGVRRLRTFGESFSDDQIRQLFLDACEQFASLPSHKWNEDTKEFGHIPGLGRILSWMMQGQDRHTRVRIATEILPELLKKDLTLALFMNDYAVHQWTRSEREGRSVDPCHEFTLAFNELLKDETINGLIGSLKTARRGVLRKATEMVGSSVWPRLGELLLRAAEFSAPVVLPQLVPFLVDPATLWPEYQPRRFNADRAQQYFGDVQKIVALFRKHEPPSSGDVSTDEDFQRSYEIIRGASD